MQIIDGYCGVPNIYADDIGEYNRSLYGTGDYVLAIGEKLGYELVSNNEVKIKDGMFLTQGRRGLIKKGTTESCVIENGLQAEKRNDLIVIEYRKDESTQVESHTLKVLKGTSGETAADPEVVTGDIGAGATLHQMPLYRVTLDGLNVTGVEQLFTIGAVAPETVDPTVATEDGFAADAKATGEALRSLNTKINKFPTPDYTNGEKVGKTYTATQDGWVRLLISKSTNGIVSSQSFAGEVKVNSARVWGYTNTITSNEVRIYPSIYSGLIPVKAGDQIEFTTTNVDSSERAFFPVR